MGEVTLWRMIVLLAGGSALLLCVAIVRAETTHLHYQISQCERRADEVRQRVREAELELARLRNPMMIRRKVEQVLRELGAGKTGEVSGKRRRP